MSTFEMLSTSLFYLCFISITWTSYQTQTNLIFFVFLVFPYFILLSTALFVFFSRTACSGCSHIISIIYTYSIIRISLFIRLGNIYIICIYYITCTISISLTWTSCEHCPHPFTNISISYFLIL